MRDLCLDDDLLDFAMLDDPALYRRPTVAELLRAIFELQPQATDRALAGALDTAPHVVRCVIERMQRDGLIHGEDGVRVYTLTAVGMADMATGRSLTTSMDPPCDDDAPVPPGAADDDD